MKEPHVKPEALQGTVIVLAEARTGSSLLMQTLRLLGKEILGQFERKHLPQVANPHGYYEDEDFLGKGLFAHTLLKDPEALKGKAVKFSLFRLVIRSSPQEDAEWKTLIDSEATLLVPIRHPVETLLSREVFLPEQMPEQKRFLIRFGDVGSLLRDYAQMAHFFSRAETGKCRIAMIDYALSVDSPEQYVAEVARAAGLKPSDKQRQAALSNITRKLYRYRKQEADPKVLEWIRTARLETIYETLRKGGTWAEVKKHIPDWAFESGEDPMKNFLFPKKQTKSKNPTPSD